MPTNAYKMCTNDCEHFYCHQADNEPHNRWRGTNLITDGRQNDPIALNLDTGANNRQDSPAIQSSNCASMPPEILSK